MADNITVTPGTGATIAAENISGALLQRVKLSIGVVDTDNGDVSATNPMPENLSQVGGSAISLGQTTMSASLPVVIASNQGSLAVTGTFYQATQPVSGTISVSNFPATQAVTQSTSPWVVSGTVTANAGTGTFAISAASLPLPTGASTSANQATEISILNTIATNTGASATDYLVTGTITSSTGSVMVYAQGVYTTSISVSGTWSGASLPVQGQLADNSWVNLPIYVVGSSLPYLQDFGISTNGVYLVIGGGYQNIRLYGTGYVSGTIAVALDGSLAQQATFSSQLGSWNVGLTAGTNAIGSITNTSFIATQATAANLNATITPLAITKGTQGSVGITVQELKDAGRNITNYFMASQVVSTATETLQSLTGYKGGVAVAATTTPAVVTAGKTYRIQKIAITYIGITTVGSIQVNLRANLSGVVAIGSPLVDSWLVGANSNTAGVAETITIDIPDGAEYAAGTGLGITVLGVGATGTAAAVGYAKITISGYEY